MDYLKEFKESIDQPERFWKRQAKKIHWFSPPESILSHDKNDFYRWFKGGTMNTCHLALDIHVENGRGNQLALIYDSPVTDTQKTFTYRELLDKTSRFAGALKDLGV